LNRSIHIFLFLISFQTLFSQESDGYAINRPEFYNKKWHVGFTIAGNQNDFRLNPKPNSSFPDTIITNSRYYVRTVYSKPTKGVAIGLVFDVRIKKYVRLRLTPNFSLSSRKIEYTLATNDRDSFKIFEKNVESAFLIVPLEVKIQSKRQGNFSAYVISGGGYALDLTARKKAGGIGGANSIDDNVKLKRDDVFYSAGAGTDFYLPYFKLGLELKLLIGTKNLLKPENSVFTNSLDKIRGRMVVFSITFEG
jgi:hypothetical protein